MKATELRIGNWVQSVYFHANKQYIQVYPQAFMQIARDNPSLEVNSWEPIPLTEEWLLKFGFETNDVRYWQISSFRLHINRYGEWIFKVETFEKEIKYVHQLQNLYFALTGEELEIKLS
jgi:hypothetical protein